MDNNNQAQADTAEQKQVEIKVPEGLQAGSDDDKKLVSENEGVEVKSGGEESDLDKTPSKKKKLCICSKITHEVEEEQIDEIEMAEELPEQVIEKTPVIIDPSAEVDLETLLAAEADSSDPVEDKSAEQPPEPDPEPDDIVVAVKDPEVKVEKTEIGVGTEDLGYNDEIERENEALRQKLQSLSRENLDLDYKETQTDFPAEDNEALNFDAEAERAKIQDMLMKFQEQQLKLPATTQGASAELSQPMQIEFEIAFDFSQDPKNPNITLLRTSSTVKDVENSTAVNQVMSVEMDGGIKVENEANSSSIEQEIPLPTSEQSSNENNQNTEEVVIESDNEENGDQSNNDNDKEETDVDDGDEGELIEVCDAATSMADLQTSSYEEEFSIEIEDQKEEPESPSKLSKSSAVQEEYSQEVNDLGWDSNDLLNETLKLAKEVRRSTTPKRYNVNLEHPHHTDITAEHITFTESSFTESCYRNMLPLVASDQDYAPTLPKCLFRELDSIVRSIAQVYSHYEDFLGKQLGPTILRPGR